MEYLNIFHFFLFFINNNAQFNNLIIFSKKYLLLFMVSNKSIILQSYITNPLLYNGRKFDIRAYMLLTIVNGKIRGYWYQEGYVRTSSYFWNIN